jgi:hypothetical protein
MQITDVIRRLHALKKTQFLERWLKFSHAVKFEATPRASRLFELDRNGPYSAAKCKQVNEIIWRTPSFATTRPPGQVLSPALGGVLDTRN